MKRVSDFFLTSAYYTILVMSLLVVGILSLIALLSRGYIYMTSAEEVTFFAHNGLFYVAVLLMLAFFLVIVQLLKRVSSVWLFVILTSIYLMLGTYVIIHVDTLLRADPHYLLKAAIQINMGDFSTFDQIDSANYMSTFPTQMGLLTLFRGYALLTTDPRYLFYMQLIMVCLSNFFLWRITNLLFNSKTITNLVILLSHLFLPSLFLILWVYGDIPGLLAVLVSFYFYLKYQKNESIWFALLAILCITFACIVRSNYLIFMVLLLILQLFSIVQKPRLVKLIFPILLFFPYFFCNHLIQNYYEDKIQADITFPPQKAWIVMGLNDKAATPGYFDTYTTLIRVWNDYDDHKVEETVNRDFQDRVVALTSNPQYAYQFFSRKIAGIWNEPTLQSIYAGPLHTRQQFVHTKSLQSLYTEGKLYHLYNKYMSVLLTSIYIATLFYILSRFKNGEQGYDFQILFALIYLIGGFLFHLAWEAKARYVWPYIYMLLPLVGYSFKYYSQKIVFYWKGRHK